MTSPRIDQVSLVLADVEAAVCFLGELGIDVPDTMDAWQSHHRTVPSAPLPPNNADDAPHFSIDLDSQAFC